MDKKTLFRIMAKADSAVIARLAGDIMQQHEIIVIKEPNKTLTMIKMREPVRSSLFYIGEVIVTEAIVELEGAKGIAVTMGDDFEKTLHMAVIDAAVNKGIFTGEGTLRELEREQTDMEQRENALHLKTMVNFNSMDAEVPK